MYYSELIFRNSEWVNIHHYQILLHVFIEIIVKVLKSSLWTRNISIFYVHTYEN